MPPVRALSVACLVGVLSLGSAPVVSGQSMMARSPSTLSPAIGYVPTTGYPGMQQYQSMVGFQAPVAPQSRQAPTYQTASPQQPTAYYPLPVVTQQPMTVPYGYAAYPYPANSFGAPYAQAPPAQYQPQYSQPSWHYAQSTDGQQSVILGRSTLNGGPPLAPPQVQVPGGAPSTGTANEELQLPMQQMPANPMPMYMQPSPGYGMSTYAYGGAGGAVWPNGYAAMYGQVACAQPAPKARNWFAKVGGVYMTRDHGDHYTFSYGTGAEEDQRTNTRHADMQWGPGGELRVGRYFNCRKNAIEAVYWGVYPDEQMTQTVSADVIGNLNGILNWDSLTYGGLTADNYLNVGLGDDGIHQLRRKFEFNNIEVNLWNFCGSCGEGKCDCSRLRHSWLVGARYFRFDEGLLFGADADDTQLTGADDEIYYNIDIENHLVGIQIGNEAQYCVSDKLTADFGIKLGVYGSRINHLSEIGGNLGVATINNGPFLGQDYYVESSKNDVAFLGEANFGLRYRFKRCWTGTVGYRALAVTGVALPSDQIYSDLRGINDVENIDSSRGLILHGGYAGIEYNW